MKEFIDWLQSAWNSLKGDVTSQVIAAILLAIVIFFWKKIVGAFRSILRYGEQQVAIPRELQNYKKSLDEETLRLNHSWKLERQSLKELIVPVGVYEKKEADREKLVDYFERYIEIVPTPRLVILGEAGSGKSVALGVIARSVWELKRKKTLLPVLITFSDIKTVTTDDDFEKFIIESLERHQFGRRKKNDRAGTFVKENLYEGNLLILIDALDELEKNTRFQIGGYLNKFFQTHKQIPFVFTSRTSVWEESKAVFSSLDVDTPYIAEFTQFEIRQYLSQWKFPGEKSAEHLAMLISGKSYLRILAAKPLSLTIVAYVYAQSKGALPDNQVKFYSECINAMLEKWDNSKSIVRPNQFDGADKISVLSRLSYHHITDSNKTDEDISKSKILDTIEEEMRALSRPVEKREMMLNEIVQNAELLVKLSEDAYTFPHRTFMEYFAALFFLKKNKHEELLELYEKDRGKWQETVAMFCGMNENAEISDAILNQLQKDFEITAELTYPDFFVFKALTQSAIINPLIANEILDRAERYLRFVIHPEMLEYLGYIAVNPSHSHSIRAKEILLSLLSKEQSTASIEQIILSLIHLPDAEIKETIKHHMRKIDLYSLLVKTFRSSDEKGAKLLDYYNEEEILNLFARLRLTENFWVLFLSMVKSNRPKIKQEAALQLAIGSTVKEFWDFIEWANVFELADPHASDVNKLFQKYTWPKERPRDEQGQKSVFLICKLVADYAIDHKFPAAFKELKSTIHNKLKYLISAILHERGYPFRDYSLLDNAPDATSLGIVRTWRGKTGCNAMILTMNCCMLYLIINIIGFFKYGEESIALYIMGGSCIGLFIFTGITRLLVPTGKQVVFPDWVKVIFFPIILIHMVGNLRFRYPVIVILTLLTGAVLFGIVAWAPMPHFYKVTNLSIISIITICSAIGCYLSPWGNFMPHYKAYELINVDNSKSSVRTPLEKGER